MGHNRQGVFCGANPTGHGKGALSGIQGAVQIGGGADESEMREGLGEVPQLLPGM